MRRSSPSKSPVVPQKVRQHLSGLAAPLQRLTQLTHAFPRQKLASPSLVRLTFASGLVFTGVLAAQFIIPGSRSQSASTPMEQGFSSLQDSLLTASMLERQSQQLADRATAAPAAPTEEKAAANNAASAAAADQLPPQPKANSGAQAMPVDIGSTIDTNLEMRVAIARNASTLKVGVANDGYLMDLDGQNYCNLPAQSGSLATANGQGINFSGCQLSNAVWLESTERGYVYIGDSWYKGRVLLLNQGGQLMAVNFVLMHDYLSSVVGSEMYVHWPLEALKAQAVAARSYALTHHVRHANRNYDLDNTQRYQAYLGVAKETNTTQQAVAATSGEFISYNGGIVESLYAASDQIVQEAHSGQGMSQTGAMQLASAGYSYEQILATYYPETGLSRLVVE